MKEESKTPNPAVTDPDTLKPETEGTPRESMKQLAAEARSILRGEDDRQEDTVGGKITWRNIISGEFLLSPAFRRQVPLLIVILLFTIVYIDNRFTVQQQIIEIDKKEKILTEMKYIALTRSSELTEATRQSRIEEAINAYQSELVTATNPPYLIRQQPDDASDSQEAQVSAEKAQHFSEKDAALSDKSAAASAENTHDSAQAPTDSLKKGAAEPKTP